MTQPGDTSSSLPRKEERPGQPVRVMLVDDNELLCSSLEGWLRRVPGVELAGACPAGRAVRDLKQARESVARVRPDVLLLDVDFPNGSGLDLVPDLLRDHPGLRIVMLSGLVRREFVERALDAGAAGYIVKDEDVPVITDLVLRAARGEIVLCKTAMTALMGARE